MSQNINSPGSSKKGEIAELQEELNHPREEKRKEAIKKVILSMTAGKDVSSLFPDVLNCMQTNNLELKKLVYLYVINHAKIQPDRAILAVNTFQRDASDPNPLIRALAIRTMGCIRVDKVTEYLGEPLRACLRDKDPYVRKTAATCVAKLYDVSPELVESQSFLDSLLQLLSDSNPSVVANAVAALTEIDELSSKSVFNISNQNLGKLQAALNECTEWGQVFILTSLSKYTPGDSKEAESICERVVPRLNHSNSAVVLAAVKLLMVYSESINNPEFVKNMTKKMGPPLVTLLTTKEPEIQYVALRNINLIVQKSPSILAHEMRVFFIKYNDPVYVKIEKLEIMIMFASEKNIEQVLNEFKEAASEVDVEFVRKAVRAIGRCAIKLEKAAERCIQVLLELIQTKVDYVVQEAIIVIKDIFRRYPNRYESIIAILCENLDNLDEPEAKASMIWIIGEYAERIDNADELLDSFLETFADETPQVQLQLLTAIVKLFLKRPKDTQEMVQKVLNLATEGTDNPDLRDRGYVYWRLLSADPEAAKTIVIGEKPLISDSTTRLDQTLLDQLVDNISTLASIYHKPPEQFISKFKDNPIKPKKSKKKVREETDETLLGTSSGNILDLDGLGESLPSTPSPQGAYRNPINELDFFNAPVKEEAVAKEIVLPAERGFGFQVSAAFVRKDGQIFLDTTLSNFSQVPISGIAIQFNKNSFGLIPAQPQVAVIMPGQSAEVPIQVGTHPNQLGSNSVNNIIQVAMKINVGEDKVVYYQLPILLHTMFLEDGLLQREEYLSLWKSISEEHFKDINLALTDMNIIQKKLEANRLFYVARRTVQGQEFLYFSARLTKDNLTLLIEVTSANGGVRICTKTSNPEIVPFVEQSVASILSK